MPSLDGSRGTRRRVRSHARLVAAALDLKACMARSRRLLDALTRLGRRKPLWDKLELRVQLTDALRQLEWLARDSRRFAPGLGNGIPGPAFFGAEPDPALTARRKAS